MPQPSCSCRSWLSTAAWILSRSILQNTLPGTDRNVIPTSIVTVSQVAFLWQWYDDSIPPIEWNLLLFHMMLHKRANSGMTASEYFKSCCIWSLLAAFPFFNLFTALTTSSSVICSMQTSRQGSSESFSKLYIMFGSGQLRTDSKCSQQTAFKIIVFLQQWM